MERSNDSHLHFILVLQCNQQRRVSQGRCKTCGAWNWSLYLQVQYSPFLKTKISIVHVRMSVYLYIMYTARRGTHTRTLSSFFLSFASIQQQKVCYEERRIDMIFSIFHHNFSKICKGYLIPIRSRLIIGYDTYL